MATRIGANPYAEEALALSSAARGQQGMLRTSAPIGPERIQSSGPTDKVEINDQPYNNSQHTLQGQKQNVLSAIPQAQSNAVRGVRKQQTDMSQQEYAAQEFATQRMMETLYANEGGAALMQLAEATADPAAAKNFMQRIGEAKLMSTANNPQAGNFQSTAFYG